MDGSTLRQYFSSRENAARTMDVGSYGDDDSADEETKAPLSWRMSPDVSFSDWKIHLKMTGGDIKTYHVHRNILSIGSRSCKYLSKLFSSSQAFAENGASELFLEEDATVDAFPDILDFIYTGVLQISTPSAVALLSLADYLGCKAAYEEALFFICDDLSDQKSPFYIKEARKFGADKILAAALEMGAAHFRYLSKSHFFCLPPDLFVELVMSDGLRCESEWLSEIVVAYLEEHRDEVNGDLIRALTSSRTMPSIDSGVAFELLRLALKHGVANEDGARSLQAEEEEEAAPAKEKQEEEGLTKKNGAPVSLKQRCFESLWERSYEFFENSLLRQGSQQGFEKPPQRRWKSVTR